MIESITKFCDWYWAGPFIVIWTGVIISTILYIPYFLLSAWKGEPLIELDCDTNAGTMFASAIICIGVGQLIAMLWPLFIIGLILVLIWKILNKWGNNYRKIVATQEEKKLTALAQLIKDDPEVKAAYEKLMKNKSLNTDIYY